jgi:RhtB (resistance to homoserine/threonine) family protein
MITGIDNYLGFVIAGILLNLTPGADTIYILTRSIAQGRKAGIISVFGISTGGLVHTILASLGLTILLSKSAMVFTVVKYLGTCYLVYLGIKMIIERSTLFDNALHHLESDDLRKIYLQGIFTNVLNPKVALFFLAFMPQFINPEYAGNAIPFLFLGFTFITTGTIWCLFVAYASSWITQTLRNNIKIGKIMQKISGLIFIGLGLKILGTYK